MKLSAKTQGPLAGLIVIDLTRFLSGPYCTMMLGDLGARVIKIELPELGDDARHVGPFVGEGKQSMSAYFFSINRNKESIALNLKSAADRDILWQLLESADIVAENFTPGVMDRLGLGWETLQKNFPHLILASISGFGQTGPYRNFPAYDMVVQAMGGIMSISGEEGGAPTRVGVSIGDIAAGMFGVIAIQAAVIERMRTGTGKHIDVAMLDSQVALLENAFARHQVEGRVPAPIGSRHPSITPFGLFQAKDGYLVIAAGNDAMFGRLCEALEIPRLKEDSRFLSNHSRTEHHAELKTEMESALAARTVSEWLPLLRSSGISCGPLNDVAAVGQDPQVVSRGMLIQLPMPDGTLLTLPGSPVRFADEEPTGFTPAPTLDQHRHALLKELELIPSEE